MSLFTNFIIYVISGLIFFSSLMTVISCFFAYLVIVDQILVIVNFPINILRALKFQDSVLLGNNWISSRLAFKLYQSGQEQPLAEGQLYPTTDNQCSVNQKVLFQWNMFHLSGGGNTTIPSPVFAVGTIFSVAFGQVFALLQVVSSHSCSNRYSTVDLKGTLCALRIFVYVTFYYLVLCPENSSHLGFLGLPNSSS